MMRGWRAAPSDRVRIRCEGGSVDVDRADFPPLRASLENEFTMDNTTLADLQLTLDALRQPEKMQRMGPLVCCTIARIASHEIFDCRWMTRYAESTLRSGIDKAKKFMWDFYERERSQQTMLRVRSADNTPNYLSMLLDQDGNPCDASILQFQQCLADAFSLPAVTANDGPETLQLRQMLRWHLAPPQQGSGGTDATRSTVGLKQSGRSGAGAPPSSSNVSYEYSLSSSVNFAWEADPLAATTCKAPTGERGPRGDMLVCGRVIDPGVMGRLAGLVGAKEETKPSHCRRCGKCYCKQCIGYTIPKRFSTFNGSGSTDRETLEPVGKACRACYDYVRVAQFHDFLLQCTSLTLEDVLLLLAFPRGDVALSASMVVDNFLKDVNARSVSGPASHLIASSAKFNEGHAPHVLLAVKCYHHQIKTNPASITDLPSFDDLFRVVVATVARIGAPPPASEACRSREHWHRLCDSRCFNVERSPMLAAFFVIAVADVLCAFPLHLLSAAIREAALNKFMEVTAGLLDEVDDTVANLLLAKLVDRFQTQLQSVQEPTVGHQLCRFIHSRLTMGFAGAHPETITVSYELGQSAPVELKTGLLVVRNGFSGIEGTETPRVGKFSTSLQVDLPWRGGDIAVDFTLPRDAPVTPARGTYLWAVEEGDHIIRYRCMIHRQTFQRPPGSTATYALVPIFPDMQIDARAERVRISVTATPIGRLGTLVQTYFNIKSRPNGERILEDIDFWELYVPDSVLRVQLQDTWEFFSKLEGGALRSTHPQCKEFSVALESFTTTRKPTASEPRSDPPLLLPREPFDESRIVKGPQLVLANLHPDVSICSSRATGDSMSPPQALPSPSLSSPPVAAPNVSNASLTGSPLGSKSPAASAPAAPLGPRPPNEVYPVFPTRRVLFLFHPHVHVRGVVNTAKIFTSKNPPVRVHFDCREYSLVEEVGEAANASRRPLVLREQQTVRSVLYKRDRVHTDYVACHAYGALIQLMKGVLKIDLGDLPRYSVWPLRDDTGILEFHTTSMTLGELEKKNAVDSDVLFARGRIKNIGDKELVNSNQMLTVMLLSQKTLSQGTRAEQDAARKQLGTTFLHSLMASCVLQMFLGLSDRHKDNIMVTANNQIMHIDFGWIYRGQPAVEYATGGGRVRVDSDALLCIQEFFFSKLIFGRKYLGDDEAEDEIIPLASRKETFGAILADIIIQLRPFADMIAFGVSHCSFRTPDLPVKNIEDHFHKYFAFGLARDQATKNLAALISKSYGDMRVQDGIHRAGQYQWNDVASWLSNMLSGLTPTGFGGAGAPAAVEAAAAARPTKR